MAAPRFSRRIATRYLWSRRGEAFITIITIISILGVAVGVMVLNMVMAIMTGFQSELKSRIVGANSHILIRSFSGQIEDWHGVSSIIEGVAGVQSVSPYTQHQALLRVESGAGNGARASGVYVRGVLKGTSAANQIAQYMEIAADDLPIFDPPLVNIQNAHGEDEEVRLPALLIGRGLQRQIAVYVGTPVSVLSPQMGSSPFGLVPRFRRFVVGGVYKAGLVDIENAIVFTDLVSAQKFFDMGNAVSGLEIRVENIDDADAISAKIMATIGDKAQGLYAQPWTETNQALFDALKFERQVYFIVLLLIIVMASFSIITTLIMLVLEKRKDIAVLRTMGASARSVGAIFVYQGATIGFIGTLLGLVLGYSGCILLRWYGFPLDEQIFQMSTVPVRIEPINFVVVGLVAFFICCLATIYPSWRASRLHPSELLRYE